MTYGALTWSKTPVSGYARDHYSAHTCRKVIFIAGILLASSICAAGWAASLNQVLVLYSVLGGCFVTTFDTPVLSMLGVYFKDKRAFASGLAISGGSLGGLVMTLVVGVTNEVYGIRGTLMILGGMWLHILVVAAVLIPMRDEFALKSTVICVVQEAKVGEEEEEKSDVSFERGPDSNGGLCDVIHPGKPDVKSEAHSDSRSLICKATITEKSTSCSRVKSSLLACYDFLRTPHLITVMLAAFFGGFAYHNQFFILPRIATEIGMSKSEMSHTIAAISITEFLSRICNGYAAYKLGQRKTLIPVISFSICIIAGFLLAWLPSKRLFVAYAVILGFFGGALLPLLIPIALELVPNEKKGSATGLHPLLNGASIAVGTVIIDDVIQETLSQQLNPML
ncbi:hypothetical protein CAPTEDRAFT_205610 [Capitella teleta]|uniref:Major facilitator superfamily (MFS) profile domain-containing protein n=1 Tax=Capitella teleta TaxID=283909 RepID=R7TXY6_CAPTE|nr:hypothetical protein CAPTEDRAFT_205610 [Capitella teleta]|eukprot:ELT98492.1 hypothetical protein CAPTEDRAFT_205610 [Capitella teleta]